LFPEEKESHVLFIAIQDLIDMSPRPVRKVEATKIMVLVPVPDSILAKIENGDTKKGYAAVWRCADRELEVGMVFPSVTALTNEMSEFLFEINVSSAPSPFSPYHALFAYRVSSL
jgi:hypothetical protein